MHAKLQIDQDGPIYEVRTPAGNWVGIFRELPNGRFRVHLLYGWGEFPTKEGAADALFNDRVR